MTFPISAGLTAMFYSCVTNNSSVEELKYLDSLNMHVPCQNNVVVGQ